MFKLRLSKELEGSKRWGFLLLFWAHCCIFGILAAGVTVRLFQSMEPAELIHAIAFLLVWIGGSVMFGLAAIIHDDRPITGHMKAEKTEKEAA